MKVRNMKIGIVLIIVIILASIGSAVNWYVKNSRTPREYEAKYNEMLMKSNSIENELDCNRNISPKMRGRLVRTKGVITDKVEKVNGDIFHIFLLDSMMEKSSMNEGAKLLETSETTRKICLVEIDEDLSFEKNKPVEIEGFIAGEILQTNKDINIEDNIVIDVKSIDEITWEELNSNSEEIELEEIREAKESDKIGINISESKRFGDIINFEVALYGLRNSKIIIDKVTFNVIDENGEIISTKEKIPLQTVIERNYEYSPKTRFRIERQKEKLIGEIVVDFKYFDEDYILGQQSITFEIEKK